MLEGQMLQGPVGVQAGPNPSFFGHWSWSRSFGKTSHDQEVMFGTSLSLDRDLDRQPP
jgi:hypothetical protein